MAAAVKTVGSAYVGSNPTPATTSENGPPGCGSAARRGRFLLVTACISMCHDGSMHSSGYGHSGQRPGGTSGAQNRSLPGSGAGWSADADSQSRCRWRSDPVMRRELGAVEHGLGAYEGHLPTPVIQPWCHPLSGPWPKLGAPLDVCRNEACLGRRRQVRWHGRPGSPGPGKRDRSRGFGARPRPGLPWPRPRYVHRSSGFTQVSDHVEVQAGAYCKTVGFA